MTTEVEPSHLHGSTLKGTLNVGHQAAPFVVILWGEKCLEHHPVKGNMRLDPSTTATLITLYTRSPVIYVMYSM